ncbi:hypothetical protein [Algoriphagus terrigena]|uniref:hypothetical protein n=1 Tax=Algoriphagus terrigena TaxID=344884 RepID=UPI00041CA84B|nr:hypothetical protein [Algoriphagus terrigena]
MNKIYSMLALIGLIAFQACEGPEGPIGPPGPEGEPGINIVSEVFEVDADFNAENGYAAIFDFDPAIVESDVVLAFIEWEKSGESSVWRALPQTYFFEQGVLIYNHDFTSTDFRLFLDGPLDYSQLSADWTQDQTFRIVIVPGDFAGARIDFTNYEAVTEMLGVDEEDFHKVQLKQKN